MWSDNETGVDFLNFGSVAATVARVIQDANGEPLSIGVSGSWGVGKSSMIKLVRAELDFAEEGKKASERKYLFVEFNAWLYQGYDDARASLMDVIARALIAKEAELKPNSTKAKQLLSRIDWLRVSKLTAGSALALSVGLPPIGLLGELFRAGKGLVDGDVSTADVGAADAAAVRATEEGQSLIKRRAETSPPKEIEAIRSGFEETLQDLGLTLVVLIDDLDRCLPETAISTLEAIRLFLFLENTAFVIAADTKMIKHAVRKHFDGVDDELVNSYFDKLVQVPIKVPELGPQDVRAYIALLYIDKSALSDDDKERLRVRVCKQLAESWLGARVDDLFLEQASEELGIKLPTELIGRLRIGQNLAPLLATSPSIGGNPRLIKRFLNNVSILISIAGAHGVSVDEAAIAKMHLLERCGDTKIYTEIATSAAKHPKGWPTVLSAIEKAIEEESEPELPESWNTEFMHEWLRQKPFLAEVDLRGVLFVSREHAPLLTADERLSSEAMSLLGSLTKSPKMADQMRQEIAAIKREERAKIFQVLLDKGSEEQSWGTPGILIALIEIVRGDAPLGQKLAAFLGDRPADQIKPGIVPRIKDEDWSEQTFEVWRKKGVSMPVQKAMGKGR